MKIGPALLGVIAANRQSSAPVFIGENSAANAALSIPAHAAGDLLLLFQKRSSSSPAAVGGVWTTPANGTWSSDPAVGQYYRLESVVDTTNTINSVTITANHVGVVLVYRVATLGALAVAATAALVTSQASVALAASGAGSLMLLLWTTSNPEITSVTGSVVTRYNQNVALGGGDVVIVDSNALVSSAPSATANFASSAYPTAQTIELLPL